jgi:hypothetical protein
MIIKEFEQIVFEHYPVGVDLNNPKILENNLFRKLISKCNNANSELWSLFLSEIKLDEKFEITEFLFLNEYNPSFIAVFILEEYERPKPVGYQPQQLVLKISVIAPYFALYFDNLVSDFNKRLFRNNPISENEILVYFKIIKALEKNYTSYSMFNLDLAFNTVAKLGSISTNNKRKPFLDECIFGLRLSIHPHNILIDKLNH